MSLDFNLTAIKDYKTVCYTENKDGSFEMNGTCHLLVFATMNLDLGTIKADNIDEWRWRIAFLNHLQMPIGSTTVDKGKGKIERVDYMPTREKLEPFIGLSTNVTTRTRKSWVARMMRYVKIEAERQATIDSRVQAPKLTVAK